MTESDVLVETTRDGDIAVVRIDHPKVNALSIATLRSLEASVDALRDDMPGALVIWGGPRIFAAGADITELAEPTTSHELIVAFRYAFEAIERLDCLTVAAITGAALGGGCELALACDLRVASTTARLGQPEILLGLIPGAGGTQRLTRTVGVGRSRDLILTGRSIEGPEALRIGLVDRLADPDRVFDEAVALAHELARGPRLAQLRAREAIGLAFDAVIADGLETERRYFNELLESEDARIGIASFLEHGSGKASFTGR